MPQHLRDRDPNTDFTMSVWLSGNYNTDKREGLSKQYLDWVDNHIKHVQPNYNERDTNLELSHPLQWGNNTNQNHNRWSAWVLDNNQQHL